MTRTHSNRKPTFFGQAVLILLPVVVMAGVALFSLRQDKMLAEQEAKELGKSIAHSLVQTVCDETARQLREYYNANGTLSGERKARLTLARWAPDTDRKAVQEQIESWQRANPELNLSNFPLCDVIVWEDEDWSSPRDYPLTPSPPSWLHELTNQQRHLWQAAQTAEFGENDMSAAQLALTSILDAKLPAPVQANVEYMLLRMNARDLGPVEAAKRFAESKWARSDDLTEAGLPIGQLVCFQALRLMPDGSEISDKFLGTIAWAIAYRPSCFSPRLIEEAERVEGAATKESGVATLKAWWDAEERTRQVFRDFTEQHFSPIGLGNGLLWVISGGDEFLLALDQHYDSGTNLHSGSIRTNGAYARILVFPRAVVDRGVSGSVAKAAIPLSAYAVGRVEIGGREWELSRSTIVPARGMLSKPLLAEATGQMAILPFNQPMNPIRVRIYLASSELLYARQQQRTFLFGGVVVASAIAAMIGLFAAHRAFRRQLALNEMKSNFVSSVSHELRAPIASVRLMAESLERGKVSGEKKQGEYFRFIVQECRRLTSLIENVLDFSRIEQGRKQYEFEPTDVSALVEQTVKLMEPYAAERGVRLETLNIQHSTFNIELVMDGRAIQQALVNLIDNAIKHSPKGETVTVGLECGQSRTGVSPVSDSGVGAPDSVGKSEIARVLLWVEDHGEGIPPQEHEKIFERFYRLGSELRRETQGVGIGLSIVKHIVEAHGGRVRVESEPGKGSRFTIEIPIKH